MRVTAEITPSHSPVASIAVDFSITTRERVTGWASRRSRVPSRSSPAVSLVASPITKMMMSSGSMLANTWEFR
jgi:hypothetical protein